MLASRSPRHAEAEPKVRSVSEVVVCSVALAVHLRATSVVRPALGQGAWYNVWPGAPLKNTGNPTSPRSSLREAAVRVRQMGRHIHIVGAI